MRFSSLAGLAALALAPGRPLAQSNAIVDCPGELSSSTAVCQVVLPRSIIDSSRAEGRLLEERGETGRALAHYRRLASQWPEVALLQLDIGRLSEKLQRRREAAEAYRRFAELEPTEPRAHELLGWSLLELRRFSDALVSFRTAAALDPTRASARRGSGSALAALGRHEEALRALGECVRLNPANAAVWGEMAASAQAVGRNREAIGYWERAIRVSPNYFDSRPEERRRWERAVAIEGPQPPAPVAIGEAPLSRDSSTSLWAPTSAPGPTSSGSGFFVARDGSVLTNKHVVRGCASVRVRGDSGFQADASITALDPVNDLALLRTSSRPAAVATFRAGAAPRPGDGVVAVGYPLSGLLADQVNVSTGSINALAGMYNDQRVFQMSAPVQPGSSGGPLFDVGGNVVGVVVTKLNAKVVAEAMGDIPQNVNFALKGSVAREFLDAQRVGYEESGTAAQKSNADVGEIGRRVTVLVECWR